MIDIRVSRDQQFAQFHVAGKYGVVQGCLVIFIFNVRIGARGQ